MKVLKTTEELRAVIEEKKITNIPVRSCSICGYPCGYIIQGEILYYDSGCNCGSFGESWSVRDWSDLQDYYNRNLPENNENIRQEYLDTLEKFWGFGDISPSLIKD